MTINEAENLKQRILSMPADKGRYFHLSCADMLQLLSSYLELEEIKAESQEEKIDPSLIVEFTHD